MRKLVTLSIVVLSLAAGSGIATSTAQAEDTHVMCPNVLKGIQFYRTTTWGWQEKLGVAKTKPSVVNFNSCAFAKWTAMVWMKRSHDLRIKYIAEKKAHTVNIPGYGNGLPPHAAGWLCIHRGEGAWGAVDPSGNYFNGLQMTYNWMGAIHGNPNDYTPNQIIWIAEKVAAAHGFSYSWMRGQWPNTFPPCASYF